MIDRSHPPAVVVADVAGSPVPHRSGGRRELALIVVGFDGSGEAAEAVRRAASLARLTGGALRVVWAWTLRDVWDTAVAEQETGMPHLPEMEAVARRRLAEQVRELVGEAVRVELHLAQGPDAADILLHAARDADVLVVGSRGRGRAGAALLGSVSARCLRESACPVLVIPHRLASGSDGPHGAPGARTGGETVGWGDGVPS